MDINATLLDHSVCSHCLFLKGFPESFHFDVRICSLTGFVNALAPQGYRLVSVILNDALFVHQRHAPQVARRLPGGVLLSPEAAFAAGYRDVPGRSIHYSWNSDTNPNATSHPTSQLAQNPRPNPTLPR